MNEKNTPPRPYDVQQEEELFHDLIAAEAVTRFGGLIPLPPAANTEDDSESYDIPLAWDDPSRQKGRNLYSNLKKD